MDVHYAMQLLWDPRIRQTLTFFKVMIQPLQIVVATRRQWIPHLRRWSTAMPMVLANLRGILGRRREAM